MDPPRSPFNPAAPVFRPPFRQTQHSPPRRPFHEATRPQTLPISGHNDSRTPPTTLGQQDSRTLSTTTNPQSTRGNGNESLRQRISQLEEDRSVKLEGFQKACEAIGEARASLEYLSQLTNFDSVEDHYRTMQSDLREMEQYRVEYGNAFETIGYELDKLYAELVVG